MAKARVGDLTIHPSTLDAAAAAFGRQLFASRSAIARARPCSRKPLGSLYHLHQAWHRKVSFLMHDQIGLCNCDRTMVSCVPETASAQILNLNSTFAFQ